MRPLSEWPVELNNKWYEIIAQLFSNQANKGDLNQLVCLCCEIPSCGYKRNAIVLPSCYFYGFGLCFDATSQANDNEPVSFLNVALFSGVSKQRIHQLRKRALAKILELIKNDSKLREYIEEFDPSVRLPPPDKKKEEEK